MAENQAPASGSAADYEAMPYTSQPFPQTQPERLAALATLFGLRPPAIENARMLEPGCASGGNILPLAARHPEAEFAAFDLSPGHVAAGRRRIEAMGLRNVRLFQGDVGDPRVVEGEWDYIVCHGLFSWVPQYLQSRILELLANHLSPHGVAYVSFNVLPGWHLRRVVRQVFSRSTAAEPAQRVHEGRELLTRLAQLSDGSTSYGMMLCQEADRIAQAEDSYLMGEFLSGENNPVTFDEFCDAAERAGLAYVCDTDLHSLKAALSDPEKLAGMDEAMLDLVQGRQFRQAVLVRADNPDPVAARPGSANVDSLHVSTRLKLDGSAEGTGPFRLRAPGGPGMSSNDALLARILDESGRIYPDTVPVSDLLNAVEKVDLSAPQRLRDALLQLAVSGAVTLSAAPLRVGRSSVEKPVAIAYARAEIAGGQHWVTSQNHSAVKLDEGGRKLLPLLDGNRSTADIAREMGAANTAAIVEALRRIEVAGLLA